jgi:hypothetical protein
MSFQPDTKTHETDLKQLHAEWRAEDRRPATLKKRLQ